MSALIALERTLTDLDFVRLRRLVDRRTATGPSALEELLSCSDLVAPPAMPPDVVTMHSRVAVVDEATGARSEVVLCYPAQAEPASGSISVLAPMGTALLGLRVGDVARWTGPAGQPHAVAVAEMLYQPEAAGHHGV